MAPLTLLRTLLLCPERGGRLQRMAWLQDLAFRIKDGTGEVAVGQHKKECILGPPEATSDPGHDPDQARPYLHVLAAVLGLL